MEQKHSRRAQMKQSMGLTTEKEETAIYKSIEQEKERQKKKENKKKELEKSLSYSSLKVIQKYMDSYFLDPIIGLIPGVGDIFTSIMTLPYIYVALFKIRSIPLTLAVIYNMLVDSLIGIIPGIGDVIDIFFMSYKKNYQLIIGFIEDDKEVIREINKKSLFIVIMIFVICFIIYFAISLVQCFVNYLIE